MANHSGSGRSRGSRGTRRAGVSAAPPSFTEPEVRRWPHPVDGVAPQSRRSAASWRESSPVSGWPAGGGGTEPALYYIHCALSYQNQLLADIKALLEQLSLDSAPPQDAE